MGAWGGISTLGIGLSLLWTEGRKRGVPIGTMVGWVTKETLQFKNKLTPHEGMVLSGRVDQTILRGSPIYNGMSERSSTRSHRECFCEDFQAMVPVGLHWRQRSLIVSK
ncbi:hypothetical protein F5148DRAFT_1201717 [Russula earlei]|uniref:Uncharacterized protein n=1 Tax=Russula earlei TaxID=71964 RepID=A0ACC0U8X1_9AGAM|nr:hypothetical protein F5148DRAFT_1201717 [Russula earlei]